MLENVVACALQQRYGNDLYYLKSAKTGIDVDFVVPDAHLAVQVARSIAGEARACEVDSLEKLARMPDAPHRFVIVTQNEEETIEFDTCSIEVVPAYRFLLEGL